MSSQTIDGCPSTAEELENVDFGIIDDQAIDREIASAYNLPVDDVEAASEPEVGGYALSHDRNYRHDMDPPVNHDGSCRGAPCRQAPSSHEIELFPPQASQRDYDLSIARYDCRSRGGAPTVNMANDNMHSNHPTHPMYQGPQQFSNEKHPTNGYNECYHLESSMDSAQNSYSSPWGPQESLPQPGEYPNSNEPLSHGTSRPTARPKRRVGRPSKRARTARRSIEPYTDAIPPPLPSEFDAISENRGPVRGIEDDIAIRGAGINDPDNIRIVNLHDNENKSWSEISNLLNADHISKGADPCFTPNNVHNRYNRNAPVLCAAEGVKFVPIKDRKKHGVTKRQRKKPEPSQMSNWSNHFDELLVQAHNEVKSWYWKQIAIKFEEIGGFPITGDQAAYRMRLI